MILQSIYYTKHNQHTTPRQHIMPHTNKLEIVKVYVVLTFRTYICDYVKFMFST